MLHTIALFICEPINDHDDDDDKLLLELGLGEIENSLRSHKFHVISVYFDRMHYIVHGSREILCTALHKILKQDTGMQAVKRNG